MRNPEIKITWKIYHQLTVPFGKWPKTEETEIHQ